MPAREAHLTIARNNRGHATWLLSALPNDPVARQWAMVAAFYSAIHCIEAYFARFNVHHEAHVDRKNSMNLAQYAVPGTVYFAYRELERLANGARYYGRPISSQEIGQALRRWLPEITTFVGL